MTHAVDLLIHSISQLVTSAGSLHPKRGAAMRELGIIQNGALAIANGHIVAVGPSQSIETDYRAQHTVNASGHAIVPGFIDPHTHVVFGGDRVHEFEMRIQGASYMEIMAAGGGIVSTMQHTRATSEADLITAATQRLDQMLATGTTTVEIKSGYGLDTATELKMLRVIEQLDNSHACTVLPTFLGAHTLPPEYKNNAAGYVDLVINDMIPAVAAWYAESHFSQANTPLGIDVFCEDHAFDVDQSRRILSAGMTVGMRPKLHVDQFNAFGGTQMAIEIGAASCDHLDVSGTAEIEALAASNTIAMPLPAANFNLGHTDYPRGRAMVDAGAALALATDLNPGSAPCYSMPLVMTISSRYLRLLPSETLTASTINAAHAIGMADRVGSLEVGKQADLLLLKSADYRNLSYFFGGNPVARVMVKGTWV